MSMLWTIGIGCLISSLFMFVLYIVQWWKKDATIVDVGWSLLIGLLTILYAWSIPVHTLHQITVLLVAMLWSARLTLHLWVNRVMYTKSEDGRYQTIRQNWGEKAQIFFIIFFQAQALVAVMFSIPILIALHNTENSFTLFSLVGILIGIGSIAGESIADQQLASFRSLSYNKGKTCRTGLWKYSRHPNYFFEWLHWFAYLFLAYPTSYWWVTLAGPIFMLLFLFRLTGIPYTEKQALISRGEDYQQYQRTTSVFIPWFPKQEQS